MLPNWVHDVQVRETEVPTRKSQYTGADTQVPKYKSFEMEVPWNTSPTKWKSRDTKVLVKKTIGRPVMLYFLKFHLQNTNLHPHQHVGFD